MKRTFIAFVIVDGFTKVYDTHPLFAAAADKKTGKRFAPDIVPVPGQKNEKQYLGEPLFCEHYGVREFESPSAMLTAIADYKKTEGAESFEPFFILEHFEL